MQTIPQDFRVPLSANFANLALGAKTTSCKKHNEVIVVEHNGLSGNDTAALSYVVLGYRAPPIQPIPRTP
eukprot:4681950-Amphidinium_carterae.1